MVARVRDMTARLGPKVFIRQCLVERPDSQSVLCELLCLTLMMCGQVDVVIPPEIHRDIAALTPRTRLVIVPNTGHLVPIEAPEMITNEIVQGVRKWSI